MWFTLHIILIAHNLINVKIDAYKITVLNKSIRHGINFSAYAITVALCIFFAHLSLWQSVVFCLSAFFNRQTTFDIPLNLRRGLAWDHVSLAYPPKAIMDRIEIWLFGRNNGREIAIFYMCFWVLSFIIQYLV